MSAVPIRPAEMRPAAQVFGITEVCEKILAALPPKDIIVFQRISKRLRNINKSSFDVREAVLGGSLRRLLCAYNDLNEILAATDNDTDLIIVDEISPLGSFNRSQGIMRVGISIMVHLAPPRPSSQASGIGKTKYIPVLAKHGLGLDQLEQKRQIATRLEMDVAFPSSRIPVDLELAVLTHRQLKDQDGSPRLAVYRIRVSLHPAPFGTLFHVVRAIREVVGMPHRRKDGKLNLNAGHFRRMGLSKDHFGLLKESPSCTEEHWRV
ncbi:hypothetical protein PRZ48_008991 [Zasmidium cellare]|uniref:F-box domain-containing protein n=1 Tax=Zasmidium cellare TaxID=395010 RepID=A0ABR0EH42_ZASCE|nr:hypothetical protein PRZ48_008991 [Zasmidium cellare]